MYLNIDVYLFSEAADCSKPNQELVTNVIGGILNFSQLKKNNKQAVDD